MVATSRQPARRDAIVAPADQHPSLIAARASSGRPSMVATSRQPARRDAIVAPADQHPSLIAAR
ncbi:hypothetical protein ACH4M7_18320, partial [Streptomyces sp. NPDC017249]